MTRWPFTFLAFLLVSAAIVGCGGSSSTSTPTPSQANITLTLSPNPATATACSPPCVAANGNSYQFYISGTLTIQETAGISGNVDGITSGSTNISPNDIIKFSGTNHVMARGTLTFPLAWDYVPVGATNPNRTIVVPLTVNFTDDRGNHLSAVTQWNGN